MDEKGTTSIGSVLTPEPDGPTSGSPPPSYLIVQSGGIPGAMLRLSAGGNRLGRAADNAFQLPEGSVSRYHAVLRSDDDGRAFVTDLGSTNGTFINGERLAANAPVELGEGDRLRFGTTVVVKFARPDSCEERFQQALFDRSVRDTLTGLYNRGYFLNEVESLAERGRMRGLGLAVLLLDIDHFKRVNDAHGHDAGDVVLREVAGVLRAATRAEDLVARYGGEEFIIALPAGGPEVARDRAERVRRAISGRPVVAGDRLTLRVTASIGLTYTPARRPRPTAELITAADQCLYQAKSAGRDRVVVSQDRVGTGPNGLLTVRQCDLDFDRQGRAAGL